MGVSFSVEVGEIFGFLGPNGAGKTTTIRILTGQLRPTAGKAWVMGCDVVTQRAALKPQIGVVFEYQNLYQRLSARDNLNFTANLYGVPKAWVDEALEQVGLSQRADDSLKKYSNGMKQRLMIARALLHRPKVLFLDEPTVGLDPNVARELRAFIAGLAKGGVNRLPDHALHGRGRPALRAGRHPGSWADRCTGHPTQSKNWSGEKPGRYPGRCVRGIDRAAAGRGNWVRGDTMTGTTRPFDRSRPLESIRIIWALFTKDALEALKNKNTIAVMITSLFMVLFYSALPALSGLEDRPALLLYDDGNSRLVPLLEDSRNIRLYTYQSEETDEAGPDPWGGSGAGPGHPGWFRPGASGRGIPQAARLRLALGQRCRC
jgi:ABC-type lipoprotein export system ATPase subunit